MSEDNEPTMANSNSIEQKLNAQKSHQESKFEFATLTGQQSSKIDLLKSGSDMQQSTNMLDHS